MRRLRGPSSRSRRVREGEELDEFDFKATLTPDASLNEEEIPRMAE